MPQAVTIRSRPAGVRVGEGYASAKTGVGRVSIAKEIVGWSEPTIMKASKALKNDLPRNDPQSQEDVGVTEATSKGHRKLNANEPLIIVAHGSAPSVGNLISNGIPTLGNYEPGDLVAKNRAPISSRLPRFYLSG